MAEMPNVIPLEPVDDAWGNKIRDRTVQRYASKTARDTAHPAPAAGDVSYLSDTGDVEVFHGAAWRRLGVPPGTVTMLAGGAVPPGWLLCNGAAVSRTTYADLFTQIGDTWGGGDGSTTFNLPDLRGRVPRGVAATGTGSTIGSKFGSDTHTHAVSGTTGLGGAHDHANVTAGANAGIGSGAGFVIGAEKHNHEIPDQSGHAHSFADTPTAAEKMQASAAINFMIRT